jgi:hypothetical protein
MSTTRIGSVENHITVSELADELGVNRRSVHRVLKRWGLKTTRSWVTTDGGRQECVLLPPETVAFLCQWFGKDA